jgi:hypothetical protein
LGEQFDQTGFSESACGRWGIIAEKMRKLRPSPHPSQITGRGRRGAIETKIGFHFGGA